MGSHRGTEVSTDDLGYFANGHALVRDGVQGRSGRRVRESQREQMSRVESVHRRPPVGSVAKEPERPFSRAIATRVAIKPLSPSP